MEKWKRKIIKTMMKQWMSKQNVSANEIMSYFQNHRNYFEITETMMNMHERSLKFQTIKLFWPVYEFIHRDKLENESDDL